MRRNLLVAFFFVTMFSALALLGCEGENCTCREDSVMVEAFDKNLCSCDSPTSKGETELSGCYVSNSCVDCYWYPLACGYYENGLKDCTSCVVCGYDCTLMECYGDAMLKQEEVDYLPLQETRTRIEAIENVHYTVDKMTISVYYGELETFTGDNLALTDTIESLIGLISMLGEETKIRFTVEYTALTELSSVVFSGDVIYDGYDWTNFTDGFHMVKGNENERNLIRSSNIQPGKHVISATIALNFYELMALEDIDNVVFYAYTYAGEA